LLDRDVKGALAAINKAIEIQPDVPGLYGQRSELHVMQGDVDAALADLDKALLIDSELTTAYAARAHLRMMKGDMRGALTDLDNAIARGEKSANVFAMRGNLRLIVNDYQGALTDFNAAISMNPSRMGNYLGRAAARDLTGDKAGALADYSSVIDAFEKKEQEGSAPDKEARRARANDIVSPVISGPASQKPGDVTVTTKTMAIATINPELDGTMSAEEMEYLPNVAAAYMNRARIKSDKGAFDALNKSLAVYPHSSAYEQRGKVKQTQGDLSAALADFNKAIELQPDLAFAYLDRGETLLKMGKDSEAEKNFAQAIKLDPYLEKTVESSRAAVKGQKAEKP
jgi:tetratricopeptide (TPR) repeat protein